MNDKLQLPKDIKLPKGILKSDLKYPNYKQHVYEDDFELWYTDRFGWCIPTLLIGRNRHGERTYATTLTGKSVRIGGGPHVRVRVKVYCRKLRKKALAPFVATRDAGQITSNNIRDSISTRRAQHALWRMERY
jgi:hypothetical protein